MADSDHLDINEVSGKTSDFRTELAKQLEKLAPEAIVDGKVDVIKLKELLAEDAGDDNERFGLFWPGKKRAMRAAQEPTTATLKPAQDLSKDWDTTQNIFIEGDNLEVLKVLQKQYHGKIKMIYIDPPYNTGKDFVYPDNYQEGLQNYLEFTKQVDEGGKKISTNSDTDGRYHSHWLNMMYPRLKLARNLLTDDGVIFISIDDSEQPHLKKLCDEIFVADNLVEQIIWKNKYGSGAMTKGFASVHEYILCYSRKPIISVEAPMNEEQMKAYKNKDSKYNIRGGYLTQPLATSTRDLRENLQYTIHHKGIEIKPDKQWIWSENRFLEAYHNGNIVINEKDGKYSVRFKQYLKDENGKIRNTKPVSILNGPFNQEGTAETRRLMGPGIFSFPKPTSLIKYLTSFVINGYEAKDFIILDFFSGSGTTADAIMQLNADDGGARKHIQVQLPEPTDEKSEAYKAGYKTIAEIARERINRAGEKVRKDYGDKLAERETPLDVGYRTYKLADTNFTKWASNFVADIDEIQRRLDLMRESSDDNASETDLLVEVLLKLGLELTTPTEYIDIAGLSYFRVGEGILVRLDETKPTLDQLRAAVDTLPAKFVILEDAFQGDDQLKTNLAQICKTNSIELWTV